MWGWKGEMREEEVKKSYTEVFSVCSPTLDIGGKAGKRKKKDSDYLTLLAVYGHWTALPHIQ